MSRLLVRAADDGLLEVLGPLLLGARVPTFPVVVPAGAGPGSKIRVKNPQTGADVNVIVPAGVTAGGQFLVPLKPADENI